MASTDLICSPEQMNAYNLDVIIVGSGPAGVAVAERLYKRHPTATIGILERGGVLTLSHILNILPNKVRRSFMDRFKLKAWEGAFNEGGMLIPALGGRGIVAGAHLRRFDQDDFKLWPNGAWPDSVIESFPSYYNDAEVARRVSVSAIRGRAQTWALGMLHDLHSYPPPVGVDLWSEGGFAIGRGYDSSVSRLWKLLIRDVLEHETRRIYVATNAYVTQIVHNDHLASGVRLLNTLLKPDRDPIFLNSKIVVLAASTVESARLFLHSRVSPENQHAGNYLAEHLECRAKIIVSRTTKETQSQGISIVIPPQRRDQIDRADRFQIHLRGEPNAQGDLEIDIGGFAAMDPVETNRVTLSPKTDIYGIRKAHTVIKTSADDDERLERMCWRIREIAERLEGEFITDRYPFEEVEPRYHGADKAIQRMGWGRSYHEAGTLRMGAPQNSVTNEFGQVHGVTNLYVADASLFPCVGVANPMLTITALAYRVADHVSTQL